MEKAPPPPQKKDNFNIHKRFRIKFWVKDVCSRLGPSMFSFNPYEVKVKQSRYRPGVAQRVPGS